MPSPFATSPLGVIVLGVNPSKDTDPPVTFTTPGVPVIVEPPRAPFLVAAKAEADRMRPKLTPRTRKV